jgi:hypothetical protein
VRRAIVSMERPEGNEISEERGAVLRDLPLTEAAVLEG